MALPKKIACLVGFLLLFLILSLQRINAWGGDVHQYLCPAQLKGGDCGIADSMEFKRTYPFGEVWHLCLDNKPDCPPRIVAKYYVKKYFLEGKKDEKLLLGAAHLIQDAACPDHWFPMREFFGRIFVPFAPSWLNKTEEEVSLGLSSKQPGWSVVRQYQGKTIVLNQAYMDGLKNEITQFVATEPHEDLATLEKQVKEKNFLQKVRSYREWIWVGLIILLPLTLYQGLRFLRTKKGRTDLIIEIFILTALGLLLGAGYLFY